MKAREIRIPNRPLALGAALVIALAAAWLASSWLLAPGPVARVALSHFTRIELPEATPTEAPEVQQLATADAQEAGDALAFSLIGPPIPQTSAGRETMRPPMTDQNGVIPLRFDLVRPGSSGENVSDDAIVVRKSLRIGGREVGSLPVHIDGDSRLLVDAGELGRVLGEAGVSRNVRRPRGANNLLTFTELRNDGVDLRYDPGTDSLVMTTG